MMRIRRILAAFFMIAFAIGTNYIIYTFKPDISDERTVFTTKVKADTVFEAQVFYYLDGQLWEDGVKSAQCISTKYTDVGRVQELNFSVPIDTTIIRFDPMYDTTDVLVYDTFLSYGGEKIGQVDLTLQNAFECNVLSDINENKKGYKIRTQNTDPYMAWTIDNEVIRNVVSERTQTKQLLFKVLACAVIDLLLMFSWRRRQLFWGMFRDVATNVKLIFSLALNDFKTKFAGSYFGIIWAFVQPVVTVLVYWFVFEKALNAGTQSTKAGITVPFVLWLIAGLVPWFFFSEILSCGTNVLIEYNYLVKKVVFQISTLPVVKVISSLFVHLFFVGFTVVLYSCYHYYPTVYTLQVLYYSFCMIMLSLGIVYMTSAVVVFFKDLSQVISIILQIGMWVTPIMWNMDAMLGRISPIVLSILKLNPMYYIVSGYRDSLINHIWFWDRPEITLYFWLFVAIMFELGMIIFKKLQVHFADVL